MNATWLDFESSANGSSLNAFMISCRVPLHLLEVPEIELGQLQNSRDGGKPSASVLVEGYNFDRIPNRRLHSANVEILPGKP
jgi:hypothetical protein